MEDKKKKTKRDPVYVKCPGSCGKMIRDDWGHVCARGDQREERTRLVLPDPKIGTYLTEKDADKRVNWMFVRMLEGLSAMLRVWGDMECKGGGCLLPEEDLFHCKACTFNGIRKHVDQGIERWKVK